MSVISLIKEKLENQDKYPYEISGEHTTFYFKLGIAVASINIMDALELDRSHHRVQHTDECIRKQSIICPKCDALVLIDQHHTYEGIYYDAFCKECYWRSDNESGRELINAWLDKNDYYFDCDCPMIEEPPQAKSVANYLFRMLQYKNEEFQSSFLQTMNLIELICRSGFSPNNYRN